MNLDKATKQQLIEYAREELGLNLSLALRRDEILARISEKMQPEGSAPHQGKVKIMIHKDPRVPGNDDVRMSINGERLVIKRGYEVWVHPKFVALLDMGKKAQRVQDPETGEWTVETTQVYPFSILDGRENYDRFMKELRGELPATDSEAA